MTISLYIFPTFSWFSDTFSHTLAYLIAEQEVLREQGGILFQKVKQAGWNKRAGLKIIRKVLREQDAIREQGGSLLGKINASIDIILDCYTYYA